jgi:hypothetical protein
MLRRLAGYLVGKVHLSITHYGTRTVMHTTCKHGINCYSFMSGVYVCTYWYMYLKRYTNRNELQNTPPVCGAVTFPVRHATYV